MVFILFEIVFFSFYLLFSLFYIRNGQKRINYRRNIKFIPKFIFRRNLRTMPIIRLLFFYPYFLYIIYIFFLILTYMFQCDKILFRLECILNRGPFHSFLYTYIYIIIFKKLFFSISFHNWCLITNVVFSSFKII